MSSYHYLNPKWTYHGAASHANAAAFARRQRERQRSAKAAAEQAAHNVKNINEKKRRTA